MSNPPEGPLADLSPYEQALLSAWTDMHKKSQVNFLVLHLLQAGEKGTDEIAAAIEAVSRGYLAVDPKSLYRTLGRLVDQGLLGFDEHPVPRSGVKRKVYGLTASGARVLAAYRSTTLAYLVAPEVKPL